MLLPRYAAGELDGAEAEAVRIHLAACAGCMDDVFRRPVGLPRPLDASPSEPPPAAALPLPRPRAPIAARGLLGAIVLLALALAGLAAWSIAELRRREDEWRREAAVLSSRLGEAQAGRSALTERVVSLQREGERAVAEAARQAEAARASAEAEAETRRQLALAEERIATLTRGVQRRDSQIDRLLGSRPEAREAQDLLATPDVAILRLAPVAPHGGVRGHVVWHPARDAVLLYAFDLPIPSGGGSYTVRVRLEGDRTEVGPVFRPGPGGAAAVPLNVGVRAARVRGLEVVAADGRPVLVGRLAADG
jgi:hypothetical protein